MGTGRSQAIRNSVATTSPTRADWAKKVPFNFIDALAQSAVQFLKGADGPGRSPSRKHQCRGYLLRKLDISMRGALGFATVSNSCHRFRVIVVAVCAMLFSLPTIG